MLADWMKQMSQEWPDRVKPLPGEAHYELRLSPTLTVDIQSVKEGAQGSVQLTSVLGATPAQTGDDFLRTLMLGNLMGEGTGGGVLAADPTGAQIKLMQKVTDANYDDFLNHLELFANYADFWAQTITKQGAAHAR